MKVGPDLVADGHRRFWCNVFILGGVPYAKIEGRLRPVTFDEKRNVYITLPLSLSPSLARHLV
jgi:hypothetical protein